MDTKTEEPKREEVSRGIKKIRYELQAITRIQKRSGRVVKSATWRRAGAVL